MRLYNAIFSYWSRYDLDIGKMLSYNFMKNIINIHKYSPHALLILNIIFDILNFIKIFFKNYYDCLMHIDSCHIIIILQL